MGSQLGFVSLYFNRKSDVRFYENSRHYILILRVIIYYKLTIMLKSIETGQKNIKKPVLLTRIIVDNEPVLKWITTFWLSQLWMSLRSESCVFIQNTVKRSANRKGIGLSGLLL